MSGNYIGRNDSFLYDNGLFVGGLGDDPNELGAKLIKAELMGDQVSVESISHKMVYIMNY